MERKGANGKPYKGKQCERVLEAQESFEKAIERHLEQEERLPETIEYNQKRKRKRRKS